MLFGLQLQKKIHYIPPNMNTNAADVLLLRDSTVDLA